MDWLEGLGYLGLLIGTFLGGTVIPFSPDVILVGMLVAGGTPWICLIIAVIGGWLGSLVSYAMGWYAKWEWIGKWLKVDPEVLEKQRVKVDKYGIWLAFFSWLPTIGTLSIITLGFYKIRPKFVSVLIFFGCIVRFLFVIFMYDLVYEGYKALF